MCNGLGQCHAPTTGFDGQCHCTYGWHGLSCTASADLLVNCTSRLSPTAVPVNFTNAGANTLNVTVCRAHQEGSPSALCEDCASLVPPHRPVVLWLEPDVAQVEARLCTPTGDHCLAESKTYTKQQPAGTWMPPLAVPQSQQVFCDAIEDCASGQACLQNNRTGSFAGPEWKVCVGKEVCVLWSVSTPEPL